jgi:AcrR family transcriptional regulator
MGPKSMSSAPSKARGRPRNEKASRAITEAALRQLADVGYGRMSMESVATVAGVSRATVYRRYRDKADMITAAIAGGSGHDVVRRRSPSPKEDLERFLLDLQVRFSHFWIEVLGGILADREDPTALALHRERIIAPRRAYALSLLEEARELGQLSPDTDVDLALDMLVGVVVARAISGTRSPPGWAADALGVIWRAFAGSEPAPALEVSTRVRGTRGR